MSYVRAEEILPKELIETIQQYVSGKSIYDGDKIVAGMVVIENDFHDRKDLIPNACAVYTEKKYRCKGISPVYLVTDHTSFYERYGWEFLCMVQGDGENEMTKMYIHR